MTDLIAALPMYDWPERHAEVDAEWARIRDHLRAAGVAAPDRLTRAHEDLYDFWRRPDILFSQTCWGPMEDGLAGHVQVVGQPSYDGIEGGQGEYYSSAIVMRVVDGGEVKSPPSVGNADISPSRGEISSLASGALPERSSSGARVHVGMISAPEGEMSALPTEGGGNNPPAKIPLALIRGKRFAYNQPDSMSGYLGISHDLEALGESLAIFSGQMATGGHRSSVRAIAAGKADVAAIDCRSWQLAKLYEPEAAGKLQVVGWTSLRKGLPFITSNQTPPHVAEALCQALQ